MKMQKNLSRKIVLLLTVAFFLFVSKHTIAVNCNYTASVKSSNVSDRMKFCLMNEHIEFKINSHLYQCIGK